MNPQNPAPPAPAAAVPPAPAPAAPVLNPLPYGCTLCDRRFAVHNGALRHGPLHHVPHIHLCNVETCGRTVSTDPVGNHVHQPLGTIFEVPGV